MTYKDVMLIAPDDVKAGTYVNFNVDDAMLGPAIRETQDIWLQSIIGTRLYNRVLELVWNDINEEEDTINDDDNVMYKDLLDGYVIPYLMAKVQAVLVMPSSYPTRNMGVVHPSDDNLNAQQLKDVLKAQQRYNAMADRFATQLSHWLCKNRGAFPELNTGSCCGDVYEPQLGKTFVHVGITFPDGKHCC